MNSYIISSTGRISTFIDNKPYTVETDHRSYQKILDALKAADWSTVARLIDITSEVQKFTTGLVTIDNGSILYNDQPMENFLTDRIVSFMEKGLPFKPLLAFFSNLMQNPSNTAIEELYEFLEKGEMPITEDGCFIGLKNVQSDWFSIRGNDKIVPIVGIMNEHGQLRNMVGDKLQIRRNQVCDDRNETCASGLHFCALGYLNSYSNVDGHTVMTKINPRDVVSIPIDYNNAKGRCCAYEVIAEYTEDWRNPKTSNGFESELYSSDGGEFFEYDSEDFFEDIEEETFVKVEDSGIYGKKPSGHKFYQKRDANGKFVKKN